ncbi:DUF3857 domain-containing transglutaminase family protein [Winogradskyella sp. PG-2]|uniref:DUF3857 domain-containing transglutaminase family protein n=1 Tax=Winogradskyella sp. PG-2 TaxID=754409 RepID=UPI00045873E3|nr:DUF3857 domain-containing transglutaminase family protein [Winogradskyella sp. PG-2]BAO77305.1 transglutaminase-like enzyme [Winogradskyella sp. PG-2]
MLHINTISKSIGLIILCFISNTIHGQLKSEKEGNWIDLQSYNETISISEDDIEYGLVTLLSDEQTHAIKKHQYRRIVTKISDNVGIQSASEISINYDPTYQSLVIHKIDVIRNDETIDKLIINNFQVLRKESNSESYIYDGSLTAMINLADIRKGDIIDYSYTIKGFNPIHEGNFSGAFYLNDYVYVNKIHLRIISNKELVHKVFNSNIAPNIVKTTNQYIYDWSANNVKPANFEENAPSWFMEYQILFVSDYQSWEEVVNWAIDVYDINKALSPELKRKVESIKAKHKTRGKRIEAILNFIQNEIRYLGLEDGIGSYKPFTPSKVFNQRFGDCKDKSLLMVTMLNALDIKAYPMLVNTIYGKSLPELLPTPKAFDHVVVKAVDENGTPLFFDPTITNQKGDFKNVFFPNYRYGLVIKEGATELEELQTFATNLIEVFDEYDLEPVGNGADLKVKTIYYDYEADVMRSYYKANSISTIEDNFKNYYTAYHDDIEVIESPIIVDDSIENTITIKEHYKLNNIWEPMVGEENQIAVSFYPSSIGDALYIPTEKTRTKPVSLYYPSSKRHNITVRLPRKWGIENEEYTISSNDFYYEFEAKYIKSKNIFHLNHFYKNQNSDVLIDNFDEYYNDIKKLENRISYYIFIPKNYVESNSNTFVRKYEDNKNNSSVVVIVLLLVVLIAVLLIYILRIRNLNK